VQVNDKIAIRGGPDDAEYEHHHGDGLPVINPFG
jgi:hypothetical protein